MKQTPPLLALLCTFLLLCATPPSDLTAQTQPEPGKNSKRLILLLPEGFHGWVCVDFGDTGAPPLPREGDALVVRPHPGGILSTSDQAGGFPFFSKTWLEINGERRALPQDVVAQREVRRFDSKTAIGRYCAFYGTVDEADAAGDAPGFEDRFRPDQEVSAAEREGLIALYQATGGSHWAHHVGWLGAPGTECSWHGVECIPSDEKLVVYGLNLFDNNLSGTVPDTISKLSNLQWLMIFGNRLTGRLPDAIIQRWLGGSLKIGAEASLLTDVSEIDYEAIATGVLCWQHRIILRADQTAVLYTERCRNATPDDRTTFCEIKEGRVDSREFARLAWLIEKNGFFAFQTDYSLSQTHGYWQTTKVTRSGKAYTVTNYATPGPFELWVIESSIEGVAASVDWDKTHTQPKCPRLGSF